MRFLKSFLSPVVLTTFLSLSGLLSAQAASFTFSSATPGFSTFVNDNDVQLASFTVTEPFAELTITTDGYAALGGFDSTIGLFSDTGDATTDLLLGQSQNIDFDNGLYDDVFTVVVPSGNYLLAITQYDNEAFGPDRAAGYLNNSLGFADPLYTGGPFNDLDGNTRNGEFRVNVVTVAVPEAPAAALVLPGLVALIGIAVRRRNMVKGN